ncbi:MAG: N-acetyl-gamma-glutamyl-phosphate reductase [Clostridia bacterium]|nr:N-acetyl-gamma-glutamyl-phosphate reductase [Clostridia bacterium]
MIQVFIDGQEGTTGLAIESLLAARTDIRLLRIDASRRKDPAARKAMLNQADVAVLCLPDEAARESVAMTVNPDVRILDASTAHRTMTGWAYGFAELSGKHRQAIATGRRIAVPGCHATGFVAAVYPLVASGLLPKDVPLTCHSITGYSGGGKKMITAYEDQNRPAAFSSPRQYALNLSHKHLPEMTRATGLETPPAFNPIVCDFYAGMAVSVPLHARQFAKPMTRAGLQEFLSEYYNKQRFVTVRDAPADGFLPANLLVGTNELSLYVNGNDDMFTLVSVLDNLGKGAAGAAMQNLNIAMGLPEDTGFQERKGS